MIKTYYVYIMTNKYNTVLYTGITGNLIKRVYQHKNKIHKGFTSNYNVNKLVYYESTENVESAIRREKQIKSGSRKKKMDLIQSINSDWQDLYDNL